MRFVTADGTYSTDHRQATRLAVRQRTLTRFGLSLMEPNYGANYAPFLGEPGQLTRILYALRQSIEGIAGNPDVAVNVRESPPGTYQINVEVV